MVNVPLGISNHDSITKFLSAEGLCCRRYGQYTHRQRSFDRLRACHRLSFLSRRLRIFTAALEARNLFFSRAGCACAKHAKCPQSFWNEMGGSSYQAACFVHELAMLQAYNDDFPLLKIDQQPKRRERQNIAFRFEEGNQQIERKPDTPGIGYLVTDS